MQHFEKGNGEPIIRAPVCHIVILRKQRAPIPEVPRAHKSRSEGRWID